VNDLVVMVFPAAHFNPLDPSPPEFGVTEFGVRVKIRQRKVGVPRRAKRIFTLTPNLMLSGGLTITDDNAERYAASARALLDMIAKLHAAGIPLVAGTDKLPGFTLHRELELYVQAGIANADVLRIATINAARVV